MKVYTHGEREYRLSSMLTPFQLEMQMHLVDWKREYITRQPGLYRGQPNDAILPDALADQFPMLYPEVRETFHLHHQNFPFRLHQFSNHVASSQVANVNLFLPVLLHPEANAVLSAVKPDFERLAVSELDRGFRIEYWDEPYGSLGDRTHLSGTDADIAIAYYNHQGEPCLWLIEHKLTEAEFTTCGGSRSPGRKPHHDCARTFNQILSDPSACYYHSANHYNFWNITAANRTFFVNHHRHAHCPFRGGMNQLWRNQLLGLSIEQDERQPYRHVTFSVVRHPGNTSLDTSLTEYRDLIADNPKFSTFTSADVIAAAAAVHAPDLDRWITWYRDLYALE